MRRGICGGSGICKMLSLWSKLVMAAGKVTSLAQDEFMSNDCSDTPCTSPMVRTLQGHLRRACFIMPLLHLRSRLTRPYLHPKIAKANPVKPAPSVAGKDLRSGEALETFHKNVMSITASDSQTRVSCSGRKYGVAFGRHLTCLTSLKFFL